ncbi:MAG TPA: AAA family ATPase [Thermoleophilia bacterium]|nr:AAA family ATPase [Thermoleophilia bacterium]
MFERPLVDTLVARLAQPRALIQAVVGPRQSGKTTAVTQAQARLEQRGARVLYASGDEPLIPGPGWIDQQWELARTLVDHAPVILALDEVHKVPRWSERVKVNWDRDTREGRDVRVVLLGSSPLLVRKRLEESLAGRFETLLVTHWSFAECRTAFGWDLDTYLFYGGYPGSAPLIGDFDRWRSYILDSLIETTVSRDVLAMARIDKPALLRQLFYLACEYSGQVVAYTKLLGQLHDAGNTTTLAHYLDLLGSVWLVTGLQKYSGSRVRRRASRPKLLVLNTALMSAVKGVPLEVARADGGYWGRLVETAIGAHLEGLGAQEHHSLFYWSEGGLEVDYVVEAPQGLTAIEVKSGKPRDSDAHGLDAFLGHYPQARARLVGEGGIALEDALTNRGSSGG